MECQVTFASMGGCCEDEDCQGCDEEILGDEEDLEDLEDLEEKDLEEINEEDLEEINEEDLEEDLEMKDLDEDLVK